MSADLCSSRILLHTALLASLWAASDAEQTVCRVQEARCRFSHGPNGVNSCVQDSSSSFAPAAVCSVSENVDNLLPCGDGCFDPSSKEPLIFDNGTSFALAMFCKTRPVDCIFPFTHDNVTHTICAEDVDGGRGGSWCATAVDDQGVMQAKHWGLCDVPSCTDDSSNSTLLMKADSTEELLAGHASFDDDDGMMLEAEFTFQPASKSDRGGATDRLVWSVVTMGLNPQLGPFRVDIKMEDGSKFIRQSTDDKPFAMIAGGGTIVEDQITDLPPDSSLPINGSLTITDFSGSTVISVPILAGLNGNQDDVANMVRLEQAQAESLFVEDNSLANFDDYSIIFFIVITALVLVILTLLIICLVCYCCTRNRQTRHMKRNEDIRPFCDLPDERQSQSSPMAMDRTVDTPLLPIKSPIVRVVPATTKNSGGQQQHGFVNPMDSVNCDGKSPSLFDQLSVPFIDASPSGTPRRGRRDQLLASVLPQTLANRLYANSSRGSRSASDTSTSCTYA